MNIKQNPIPNTISIPTDVKESARHIIRIQYIKVKYNSIPLITSDNVDFIVVFVLFFVKIFIKSKINCWADSTFSLRFNK